MSGAFKYASRSGAMRAARAACKAAIGPAYEAFEGPDFAIHPQPPVADDLIAGIFHTRYTFELRGPAANMES